MNFTIPFIDFEVTLNVVIFGCVKGMTYSLIAVGLTLVYKSTRVLNFAAGEMGALPALLIPWLVLAQNWPYWVALPLALLAAVTIGGLSELLVIRPLARAPRLTVLVATIGLGQVLFAFGVLLPNAGELTGQRYPVPFSASLSIGSLTLTSGQLLILACAPLTVLVLTAYLRCSTTGKASRAAAQNAEAARLVGIPIQRASFAIWTIAGLLAGVAAILAGPTRPLVLSQALGPDLLLRALGAAMIGGLVSIWGSFAGGVLVGVLEALIIWNYPTSGVLDLAIAAVIVVSLLVRKNLGGALRGRDGTGWTFARTVRPLPPAVAQHPSVRLLRWGTLGALVVIAVLVPMTLQVSTLFLLSNVVLFALMGLSIVVLTGYAGHVSLGQFAFVAIGAATGGRLMASGLGFVPAIAITTVIGCLVAILVGLPALRVRGLFLATTTLAFAVVTVGWLFRQTWLVTRSGEGSSLRIQRPTIFGIDFVSELAYYWLCLGTLAVGIAIVASIRRSSLGRMLVAVRDNESSAAALGLSPRRVKLTAFVIAGGIATFAGFLFGGLIINFSNDPQSTFSAERSLSLVVTSVFGGVTTVTGVVLGAVWIDGIPRLLGSEYALLTSGFALILVLVLLPGGLATAVFEVRDRLVRWLIRDTELARDDVGSDAPPTRGSAADDLVGLTSTSDRIRQLRARDAPTDDHPQSDHHQHRRRGEPVLVAEKVTVRFGGLAALQDVSIHVDQDEMLGLMGPNGAGKTTLFDVLSGSIRPTTGRVLLGDRDITTTAPHTRARLGIGRTHQQAQLFGDLTLLECVCVSLEQSVPTRAPAVVFGWPGTFTANRRQLTRAGEIVDLLGLGPYADRPASQLPTGVRRLAELACVIGLGARVLLLDEPAAGLTGREIEEFGRVIRGVRDHLGATVIVIDHDVHMMAQLVDRLYVLDAGELIAQGPVSLLETDARVIEAYLGTSYGKKQPASID